MPKQELFARDFDEWAKMAETTALAALVDEVDGVRVVDLFSYPALCNSIKVLCVAYHELLMSDTLSEADRDKMLSLGKIKADRAQIREDMLADFEEATKIKETTKELFDKLGLRKEENGQEIGNSNERPKASGTKNQRAKR